MKKFANLLNLIFLSIVTFAAFTISNNVFGADTLLLTTATPAPSTYASSSGPVITPQAPSIHGKAYVLLDADSGVVLAQNNMNLKVPPASLTKLMTLYLIFQQLQAGRIKLNEPVRIGENAWRTGGSRMFLKLGSTVPVQDLVNGIIIASGNDACVALAEFIAGGQDSFSSLMNQTAQRLGMRNSHYVDATGLPDPSHYSTAYDLALLARALIYDFPSYYPLFKQKWIYWNNIKQPNRDRLLWRDPSVDGLKTGHTGEAGYCLVSSAKRNGMRLISVVLGEPSDAARANDAQALLNWGFRFFETHRLFEANKAIAKPRVWLGKKTYVPMGVKRDLFVTIPSGQFEKVKAVLKLQPNLSAPIKAGESYGTVEMVLDEKPVATAPIIALENDVKGGLWTRFKDRSILLMRGWFGKS